MDLVRSSKDRSLAGIARSLGIHQDVEAESEDRPDELGGAPRAATELVKEPPSLEGGHGLVCRGANVGVRDIDRC